VWKQLGVDVTVKPQDTSALDATLLSTGNWDIAWEVFNLSSPDQLVPILSGAVPPNGDNFAHIDNAAYDSGVAKAGLVAGTAGCAAWLKAESNLVSAADVIPFANQAVKTFGSGAKFDQSFTLIPTSIRMLAG
jgi:peptide/nickel transport system substrate-binding protein